jgi:hypothetical protein
MQPNLTFLGLKFSLVHTSIVDNFWILKNPSETYFKYARQVIIVKRWFWIWKPALVINELINV